MKISTKKYSILISPPDFITYQPSEDYERALLNIWIEASKVFESSDFYFENEKVNIKTDWKKNHHPLEHSIEESSELILSVNGTYEHLEELSTFFLNRFLEMMFITMNISVPGSLNLYNRELKDLDNDSHLNNWGISLTSSPFEHFWEVSREPNDWPKIEFISLEKVVNWYKNLNVSFKQKASSNIDRCFFALINYCQENSFSPSSFIWITHSLEALYDTPRNGIIENLKNRIFLFLDEPSSHSKKLRKKIGDLYDFRSDFVHGTMEIARMPFFENLDKELEDYMIRVNDLSGFGIMLLLATIQKMVSNDAKELVFYEKYEFE